MKEGNFTDIMQYIEQCAINFIAQNDKIAECLTKTAIQQHSLNLLGCTIQCSITNWKSTQLFVECIVRCANDSLSTVSSSKPAISQKYVNLYGGIPGSLSKMINRAISEPKNNKPATKCDIYWSSICSGFNGFGSEDRYKNEKEMG